MTSIRRLLARWLRQLAAHVDVPLVDAGQRTDWVMVHETDNTGMSYFIGNDAAKARDTWREAAGTMRLRGEQGRLKLVHNGEVRGVEVLT